MTKPDAVDFLSLDGPFVVIFHGEAAGGFILDTAEDVVGFLLSEDGGGLECNGDTEAGLHGWLSDAGRWKFDDGDRPFEWSFEIGEISSVSVTTIMQPKDMGYTKLRGAIEQSSQTWLPGLLAATIQACRRKEVFAPGGLLEFVQRAAAK